MVFKKHIVALQVFFVYALCLYVGIASLEGQSHNTIICLETPL